MSEISRKRFLGMGAAAAAAAAVSGAAPARPSGPWPTSTHDSLPQATPSGAPDLVVVNGRVLTQDDTNPSAEAFAVSAGRITAVGTSDDVRNLVGRGTEVLDVAGMTVVPGFIDAHSHPSGGGVSALVNVDTNLGSVAAIKDALAARARETPPGEWVVGYLYDDTKLIEGRPLNRWDLDEAVPDHPVAVGHRGGHTGVYNALAFQLAGITADTPDPRGGRFYREGGELTGKVAERARGVFRELMPSGSTREQRQAGIKLISGMMNATGLTSVHQTGTATNDYIAYQDALDAGELGYRAYLLPRGGTFRSLTAAGVRTGFGGEWVRIGAVKFAADGSASERTMRMSTPYVGRPDDFGILTMSQEEIHEGVEEAHRAGWQVGIHANGDVTIDMVLNAYERVQELWPRPDCRHRIEHCSLVNPDLLRRIKAAGVIPTPFYTYVYYHGNKWVEYGPEKMEWMFAHKSFLDYGIPVGPASDYTPGPFEPLMAIQSMVTRTDYAGRVWGASQRITVDQALKICTVNGAYAGFEEDVKGSITAGKYADFAILEDDPHDVDPAAIKDIPVVRTVVNGASRFEA